jgi:tripartite-type tricarboxylate transporter receptor subunit TctC
LSGIVRHDFRDRARLFAAACGLIALAASAFSHPAAADEVDDFFKNKVVTLNVGYEPGTSYDVYSRLLARYLAPRLPGKATLIVKNMPGASTVVLANYLYNVAPRDGTVFGAVHERISVEPLLDADNPQIKYDALKLNWLGSIAKQTMVCFTMKGSATRTLEDLMTRETLMGGSGATGDDAVGARVVNAVLGTKIKLVTGYDGGAIYLALERREVEGRCGFGWPGLKAAKPDWVRDGRVNVLLQMALTKHPELPNVPLLIDLVKDKDDLAALKVLFGTQDLGRPYIAPPGIPQDRVEALRRAFDGAINDPEFRAEAKKRDLDVDPVSGEDIVRLLKRVYEAPASAIRKVDEWRGIKPASAAQPGAGK